PPQSVYVLSVCPTDGRSTLNSARKRISDELAEGPDPDIVGSPKAVSVALRWERSVLRGMIMSPAELSSSEAERLRAFERQGHDALAGSYHAFFAAVTALATNPLLDAVHVCPGTALLDVATGPGVLAAEAA